MTPYLIILAMSLTIKESMCNQGRDFILVFPKTSETFYTPSLTLVCVGEDLVQVTVSSPNALNLLTTSNYTIWTAWTPYLTINLSPELILSSSGLSNNTVYIRADGDIVVSASETLITTSTNSRGTYLVLPLTQLSTRYHVVTYCYDYDCFIVVAAASTAVNVTLTLRLAVAAGTPLVSFGARQYGQGDVIVQNLREFSSMQILGSAVDMSGSVVIADGVVAVITGGSFTAVSSYTHDQVMEQVTPSNSYGTSFVITGYAYTTLNSIVKIVYTEQNTSLTFDTSILTLSSVNTFSSEYDLRSGEVTALYSNKPILVVLLSRGSSIFDPAFVLILPVEAWSNRYTLAYTNVSPDGDLLTATLVTYRNCTSLFLLNGIPNLSTWSSEIKEQFKTCEWIVNGLIRNTIENNKCLFGGFLSAMRYKIGNALPLGFPNKLQPTIKPTPSSVTCNSCTTSSFTATQAGGTSSLVYSYSVSEVLQGSATTFTQVSWDTSNTNQNLTQDSWGTSNTNQNLTQDSWGTSNTNQNLTQDSWGTSNTNQNLTQDSWGTSNTNQNLTQDSWGTSNTNQNLTQDSWGTSITVLHSSFYSVGQTVTQQFTTQTPGGNLVAPPTPVISMITTPTSINNLMTTLSLISSIFSLTNTAASFSQLLTTSTISQSVTTTNVSNFQSLNSNWPHISFSQPASQVIPTSVTMATIASPQVTEYLSSTVPLTTQNVGSTVPLNTQNVGSTVPLTTQNVGSTVPLTTQNVGSTVPLTTQNVGSNVPLTTQNVGSTVPLTTQNVGSTVPLTTQNVGSTVPLTTQNVGSTVPLATQNLGSTVPINTDTTDTSLSCNTNQTTAPTTPSINPVTQQPTPDTTLVDPVNSITKHCPCSCSYKQATKNLNVNQDTKQTLRQQIEKHLKVSTSELTATIQKKISLENVTPTSQTLGQVICISCLCLVFCGLVLTDIFRVLRFLYSISHCRGENVNVVK